MALQRCVLEAGWALHCVLLALDDGQECLSLLRVNLECISVGLKWFFHVSKVVLREVMKLKCKCLVVLCYKC